MKKIIIAYCTYGGGHFSAAKNIKEYIEKYYPDSEILLFDFMKYINKAIDKISSSTYTKITTNIPWLWGKIYYHTQDAIFDKILSLSNKILSYKLRKILKEFEPDIIISTHFFVGHMFSILKQKGKTNAIISNIITDYGQDPYNEWIKGHEYIDYIFVPHLNMKKELIKKGVFENKIYDTGIPISMKFLTKHNADEILKELNFEPNKKTILFFGGGELGLGKSKTSKIFENLVKELYNVQIIAISGKNENLKNHFEEIVYTYNKNNNVKVIGYTTKIAELMSISDIVITKPGGLTTTESLVSNLPIIAINPIPGQETENATFLEQHNASIWAKDDASVANIVKDLFTNEDKLNNMILSIKKIAKPNATKDICSILMNTPIKSTGDFGQP